MVWNFADFMTQEGESFNFFVKLLSKNVIKIPCDVKHSSHAINKLLTSSVRVNFVLNKLTYLGTHFCSERFRFMMMDADFKEVKVIIHIFLE